MASITRYDPFNDLVDDIFKGFLVRPVAYEGGRNEALHFRTSNFFGSIFALILNRSNVVSSVVSEPVARRSRNGHWSPSTSR